MSKRKKISEIIHSIKGVDTRLEKIEEAIQFRAKHNLGPAMTLKYGDSAGEKTRQKRLKDAKDALNQELINETTRMKKVVKDYVNYLQKEVEAIGYELGDDKKIVEGKFSGDENKQKRYRDHLMKRYHAMLELDTEISGSDSITDQQLTLANAKVKVCLDNKPEFKERSFLQQLAGILTLGLRYFFSTENTAQKELATSAYLPTQRLA